MIAHQDLHLAGLLVKAYDSTVGFGMYVVTVRSQAVTARAESQQDNRKTIQESARENAQFSGRLGGFENVTRCLCLGPHDVYLGGQLTLG
jgi:hypothetical protein